MTIKISSTKVLISYAWESDEVKEWVLSFSTTLRNNGIDVTLDQWEVVPGDRMPYFMEMAVRKNNYVLIICSEKYKQKSENRQGGLGVQQYHKSKSIFKRCIFPRRMEDIQRKQHRTDRSLNNLISKNEQ
jgi:hypothetical protein